MFNGVTTVSALWSDPESAVKDLTAVEADLEERLAEVREAKQLAAAVVELNGRLASRATHWADTSQSEADALSETQLRLVQGPVIGPGTDSEWADEADLTRRPKILQTLRRAPRKRWSARAITEECGLENPRSVRTLLEEMVRRGELVRIPGPAGSRKVFYQIAPTATTSTRAQPA